MCVGDALVKNVLMLYADMINGGTARPRRILSHGIKRYLINTADLITIFVLRDFEKFFESVPTNKTQTESPGVSGKSAFDYTAAVAPFRLFTREMNEAKTSSPP